jgi:FG-GAP-like repeat/FG-GAP repeat
MSTRLAGVARLGNTAETASRPNRPTRIVALIACALFAAAFIGSAQPAAAMPFIQQGGKLVGTNAVAADQGRSVALSADGNTLIVGGPADNSNAGAAWVFTRAGGSWTQQGAKLFADNAVGAANQGRSVALSADGNTAIVGGPADNAGAGAAWIFTRSGGVWTQQAKLTGSDVVGAAKQGSAVALSGDGNTAIVGGYGDNTYSGAAWVFTRSNGSWTQQGAKLVGTGAVAPDVFQGWSVALSGDGNTAIEGGYGDHGNIGAAWVFIRSGGVWSQPGAKLLGSDAAGAAEQGSAVALSADGNTATVGGSADSSETGAAWVFIRSGNSWSQQGSKLVGSDTVGLAEQGAAVALSSDGNSAMVGGSGDDSDSGAAWVFTRNNGVWTQLGSKLIGNGTVGNAYQGTSVALSSNGSTAVSGGFGDDSNAGAAWVFTRDTAATHDFDGDGKSDIAWRDLGGNIAIWLMNGAQVASSGGFGAVPTTWSIVGQRDFNGDGNCDLLWRDNSGNTAIWLLNGLQVASTAGLGSIPTAWSVAGTGDFDGDGKADILWRDSSGNVAIWFMNGTQIAATGFIGTVPLAWSIVGIADFDGDGKADIPWRGTNGNTAVWLMNGAQISSSGGFGVVPTSWSVAATGDFDGDGKADVLWRDSSGNIALWFMNGAQVASTAGIGNVPTSWTIAETGDFDGDGKSDILWVDNTGNVAVWFMNGSTISSSAGLGNVGTSWSVQSLNAE